MNQTHNKKRASCERNKKLSHIEYTVHLHRLQSPGVGRNSVLRGTCHMLSESGLKQKPIKYKQDSQPVRQPDPPQSGGGEQRLKEG